MFLAYIILLGKHNFISLQVCSTLNLLVPICYDAKCVFIINGEIFEN